MKRAKLPSRDQIRSYWAPKLPEKIIGDDACFACGCPINKDSAHAVLHRAHILARLEGGSDDVDNLHVLCAVCHEDSEYLSGDRYWSWFNSRNQVDQMISALIRFYGLQPSWLIYHPERLADRMAKLEKAK